MFKKDKAVKLQKDLLQKGYNFINICAEFEDDDIVSRLHCVLLREQPEDEYYPTCPIDITYHLSSEDALELLEHWVEQVRISPDPRKL
jgi:hypothetical protein